ncbi:unnamed protein product, partial [Nesidiocoris tenuis]
METRRAAGTRAGRCRAGQSEPFDQLAARTNTAEVLTSRPARLSKPYNIPNIIIIVVLWKHSVVREVQHLGVCSRRTSANEERRGQTLCDKEKSKQGAPFWDSPMFLTTSSHISHCLAPE